MAGSSATNTSSADAPQHDRANKRSLIREVAAEEESDLDMDSEDWVRTSTFESLHSMAAVLLCTGRFIRNIITH